MIGKKDIAVIKAIVENDRRSHAGVVQPFMQKLSNNTRAVTRTETACDKIGYNNTSIIGVGPETVAGE